MENKLPRYLVKIEYTSERKEKHYRDIPCTLVAAQKKDQIKKMYVRH